jgi:hypothetical protein
MAFGLEQFDTFSEEVPFRERLMALEVQLARSLSRTGGSLDDERRG